MEAVYKDKVITDIPREHAQLLERVIAASIMTSGNLIKTSSSSQMDILLEDMRVLCDMHCNVTEIIIGNAKELRLNKEGALALITLIESFKGKVVEDKNSTYSRNDSITMDEYATLKDICLKIK